MRVRFTIRRLMIVVAVVGIGCWMIVVPQPEEIRSLLIVSLGPLVGACWGRFISQEQFDSSTYPDLHDRLFRSILGGIRGGIIETAVLTSLTAIVMTIITIQRGMGFHQRDLGELIVIGAFILIMLLSFSVLAGIVHGVLVWLLAEAVSFLSALGRRSVGRRPTGSNRSARTPRRTPGTFRVP